ncbi:hypothetical protein Sjap_015507 [Stephania japonica]|uniref:Reverse transcriptase Ty1/copia-type domain-containing protein n=1 Tax=Stephania japonica TaxID=461633 RepID=A0AAP0NSX0_9MAGN
MYITRHVLFNEDEFPYSTLFTSISMPPVSNGSSLVTLPVPQFTSHESCIPPVPSTTFGFPSSSAPGRSSASLPISQSSPQSDLNLSSDVSLNKTVSHIPPVPSITKSNNVVNNESETPQNVHPMVTRAEDGISKKKVFVATTSVSEDIPQSVDLALKDPKWRQAMENEYQALIKNGTWSLVPAHSSQNVVDNKWIFTVKKNSDGSINRYKARLVARGFKQLPGIDFDETFSPVVKASTIRIILSIAVQFGWSIRQLDIHNAFLNGSLIEDVYTNQPKGFLDNSVPTYVCKLHKALYGLRQAPRAWFDRLRSTILSWGFVNSKVDNSLFIFHSSSAVLYILVYVDDIIVTGSHPDQIQQFVSRLNDSFALKDIGDLNLFLGMEARRDTTGLFLTQTAYIKQLLQKGGMLQAKAVDTPALVGKPLFSDISPPFSNATLYRSLLGGLQYLVHTIPDIAFIVNRLSQYQSYPTQIHWQALKRVLRYLKDWAAFPHDRRSVSRFAVFFGSNLISWQSKKQHVVARSSTESEYRALAQISAEITRIQSLLSELQFSLPTAPVVWCDNISAQALAHNPVYHARTKHIELDIHYVRDKVLAGQLSIRHVPSSDQIADGFTKALAASRFSFLRSKFGVVALPLRLRGDVRVNH